MLFTLRILLSLLFLTTLSYANTFKAEASLLSSIQKLYGDSAVKRFNQLIVLMNEIETKNKAYKLKSVNHFFNTVPFDTDQKIWHQKDYWASRSEFMGKDKGDCEDYSIAKYFTLRQLGFSDEEIFLTYVEAINFKQAHMVLTFFKSPQDIPLILDNLNQEILPATQRADLRPIFNFNGDKIYMAKLRGLGKTVPRGKIDLSKWTNLILKIRKEKN